MKRLSKKELAEMAFTAGVQIFMEETFEEAAFFFERAASLSGQTLTASAIFGIHYTLL